MENAERSALGRSALIVGVSAALGLLFDYFFWETFPFGVGLTVYLLLITLGFFGISQYAKRPVRGDVLWLFPLVMFFATMVAVRANLLLSALNILACLGLLLLIMETSVRGSVRRFVLFDYLTLLVPLGAISAIARPFADILSSARRGTDQKRALQIMRGILITAPVVIVFALLFSSADPVFGKYVHSLTNWGLDAEDVARTLFVLAATLALVGFYSYALFAKPDTHAAADPQNRLLGHVETTILLGSVNTIFLAFIAIQLTYLFGGEGNITAQGFTYAEYARRGFFELVAVAILSYLVLLTAERIVEKHAEVHSRAFRWLSSAMIVQVGVIMVSAFYRMWLYENAFGFTTLRVYVHAFIVLLAVVFACLLYKILVENRDDAFAFRTFWAVALFVAGMNLFNPDAFIAEMNLKRFAAAREVDTAYLATLSADATPTILAGLDTLDALHRAQLGHDLYVKYGAYEAPSWVSWNMARAQERVLLMENAAKLETYRIEMSSATSTN